MTSLSLSLYKYYSIMTKFKNLGAAENKQFIILSAIILGVTGMTGVLNFSNPLLFQRFIGEINPIVAIFFSGILGLLLFFFLLQNQV